jgi:SWI/SNF-related matrix-associated actin-dependent regulator 1 of chromatin subfamily A
MYGTLTYKAGVWVLEAEPRVLQVAKRVLPGCTGKRSIGNRISFHSTARSFEDLNWLMLRFPLHIKNIQEYERDLDRSRELAARRDPAQPIQDLDTTALFNGQLRPYQAEGVAFLLHNRRTLLADWVGLGKTVMALGALAQANSWPAVVVAPPSVLHQWREHADQFVNVQGYNLLDQQAVILKGQTPYDPDPAPIYILHYGLLQYWEKKLKNMGTRVVVFDEVQDLRHTGTQKYSAASNLSMSAEYVWGLSATPIHNYGGEIWSIMNVLEFHCLDDYDSFSKEWCTGYGERVVKDPDLLGQHLRREGLMIRRVLADVNLQLPPIRRAVTRIDHDQDVYNRAISKVAGLAAVYNDIREWNEKGKAKMELVAADRHATGVAKAPYVAAFIASLIEAGEKVLIFAWHHDVHDILLERLRAKYKVVQLTGRQTATEKQAAQKAFGSGEADAITLSLRTVAGLNELQNHGTCCVFAELDWSPATHTQCEGRLHRMGVQVESVLSYYLVAATGYDEVMQEALGLKSAQFKGLMAEAAEGEEQRKLSEVDIKQHLDRVVQTLVGKRKGAA